MKFLIQYCTLICLWLFLFANNGIAQLSLGQWRDHLCYKKGIAVTQNSDKIYCATESGLFSLSKKDNSIERLSKITGLSDVGISTIDYNDYDHTLLVAYKNANIDLIRGSSIYNISDIKRYIITAKKTINNIHFINNLAYLSCGFGIVVLDMDRNEIKESYYIGNNGSYLNVREVTSDADFLYAATDSGVYYASIHAPNLTDFKSWKRFSSLPAGVYNTITVFAGKVFTNYSAPGNLGWGHDTIYSFDGTKWNNFLPDSGFWPVRKIENSGNKLIISSLGRTDVYDASQTKLGSITGYNIDPYQCIVDDASPNTYWMADNNNGLTKSTDFNKAERFAPNGPNTSEVYSMKFLNGNLWVARGNRIETWAATYLPAEAYHFSDENWSSITKANTPAMDTLFDIVSVAIDPKNSDHVFLGTGGRGLIELKNNAVVHIWNETNSSLQSTGWSTTFRSIQIFGMAYDTLGNLWVSNSTAPNPLSVLRKDGSTWQSFGFSSLVVTPTASDVLINKLNQKWVVLPRGNGILVFDDNGTATTGDDKAKRLTSAKGNGNLPSNEIECIAEDHNGQIWVGTDVGIAVFYCADQVLSSSGCEAQQILIQQDGHTQILLATEVVTTIAIDGANRKWIGTQNSGVFLMSEDGTKEIHHFTTDNSPLLSNEVHSIVINPKTGEVFFGTEKGILSFRSDATEGLDDYTNVYVYPNPVKPGYDGPIAITGLITDADVKITDISGNLVYQTKALGGQAIWYGKNFNGERAHSGVYLVFCSNEDGSKTFVTKVLLVN